MVVPQRRVGSGLLWRYEGGRDVVEGQVTVNDNGRGQQEPRRSRAVGDGRQTQKCLKFGCG